jgi:peptide/nickel transport system ATP-binding protein
MIFQEPRQSLNPLLRIGGQITETLEPHGEKDRSGNRAVALEMLARMGFTEPEKIYRAYPHQLSPGMCQRVMIAIASICKPKLLIADEATNSLDSTSRDQVLDLLRRMNREHNTAILFITHDLLLVRRICRRIMIMYAGKIIEEGPVDAVCDAPAHPYTQALIAAIPGKRGTPLPEISGKSPSIEDRITGCPFAGRCTHAAARCRAQFPPAVRRGDNHTVHCVRAEAGNV